MADSMMAQRSDFGAVVVGASLAGCTTATLLARAGVSVALVERSRSPEAFKRVCGHYIQASAVPTLERLGLMESIEATGGVRSHGRLWTRWGTIEAPPDAALTRGVNLRRERLDPLVRGVAAEEPGVEPLLGYAAKALLFSADGSAAGVEVADPSGRGVRIRAPLVVGADGRDSRVAAMAGLPPRSSRHGRFSYAAYFEGPDYVAAPDATIWMLDPEWAAAFPTDGGQTMYACMPTMDRLPEFKRDPGAALEAFIAGIPDAPPIAASRRVSPVIGKIKMPNVRRGPVGAGVALAGDAALATDPLWGVGCGWAFQSGEWLAESVAAALRGDEPLARGLRRYRRRFRRRLAGHSFLIDDYATGRRFSAVERLLYSAGASDERVAARLLRFGARSIGPTRLAPAYGRAMLVSRRRPASTTPAPGRLALRR